jgi:hypothetical protein
VPTLNRFIAAVETLTEHAAAIGGFDLRRQLLDLK